MCGPDNKSTAFGAWVAQMEEHQTFNLMVQGSSPCPGVSWNSCPVGGSMSLSDKLDKLSCSC